MLEQLDLFDTSSPSPASASRSESDGGDPVFASSPSPLPSYPSPPESVATHGGFRWALRDLWEPYLEGRLTIDVVAGKTASRIRECLTPAARDAEERAMLDRVCRELRSEVWGRNDYSRIMRPILGSKAL